jgi:hypothetical protein
VTDTITTWAEVLGCLALALGFAWLAGERLGIGWGLVAFGTAILFMSALISAASKRRGGVE